MKHTYNFWVLGGDKRQIELARLLARDGHTVHTFAAGPSSHSTFDGIEAADCILFPLPVSRTPDLLHAPMSKDCIFLEDLLRPLSPRQLLLGGRVDDSTHTLVKSRGLIIHDYFLREELAVSNAVPTAEGALRLAMEHLPITIHGARVLVLGFGRVGKVTAQRFAALGARVCAAARAPEQLAWADTMGVDSLHLSQLTAQLPHFDLIINTIPAPILHRDELDRCTEDCLIIDLASAPGGLEPELINTSARRIIYAPGLPGKEAPVTAGAILKTTVYYMLRELG